MSKASELLPTTFTDSTGEVWTIPCDVNAITRVAKQTGIKLTDVINPASDSYRKWVSDYPITQVAVLYALVEDEARARGITAEDVGKRLADQDAFDGALRAITNAVVNFTHPSRRTFLMTAIPQAEAAFDRMREQEAADLEAKLGTVDWDKTMRNLLTDLASATDSPASSGLTQDREHSAN